MKNSGGDMYEILSRHLWEDLVKPRKFQPGLSGTRPRFKPNKPTFEQKSGTTPRYHLVQCSGTVHNGGGLEGATFSKWAARLYKRLLCQMRNAASNFVKVAGSNPMWFLRHFASQRPFY
jgi:hypothetical protein